MSEKAKIALRLAFAYFNKRANSRRWWTEEKQEVFDALCEALEEVKG